MSGMIRIIILVFLTIGAGAGIRNFLVGGYQGSVPMALSGRTSGEVQPVADNQSPVATPRWGAVAAAFAAGAGFFGQAAVRIGREKGLKNPRSRVRGACRLNALRRKGRPTGGYPHGLSSCGAPGQKN